MFGRLFGRAPRHHPLPRFRSAKRILVVGEFWQGANGRGYARAFRELGFDVIELDVNRLFPRFVSLSGRVVSRIMARQFVRNLNQKILNEARAHNIDYAVFIKGVYVDRETISHLKKMNIKTIIFYPDVLFDQPGISENFILENDFIFTTKKFHVDYFKNDLARTVYHLNHGFYSFNDQNAGMDGRTQHYDYDICYVGNASPYKFEWMEKLSLAFADRKIVIVGNGWEALAKGGPLEKCVLGYPVSGDRLGHYISRSRINLAFHFGPVGEHHWQDDVSLRSFQIPAIGGFMLHIDNDEIRSLYAVPDEIDVFSSPEDLIRKVDYYLTNPTLRERMAKRSHLRCIDEHDLTQRVREMMAVVQGTQG